MMLVFPNKLTRHKQWSINKQCHDFQAETAESKWLFFWQELSQNPIRLSLCSTELYPSALSRQACHPLCEWDRGDQSRIGQLEQSPHNIQGNPIFSISPSQIDRCLFRGPPNKAMTQGQVQDECTRQWEITAFRVPILGFYKTS